MDLLNLDLEGYKKYAIDAWIHVYGEDYKEIIEARISNALIIPYNDVLGLDYYIDSLKKAKSYQLALSFLKQIGQDITPYENKRSIELFYDTRLNTILNYYFGTCASNCFNDYVDVPFIKVDKEHLNFINKIYKKATITPNNFDQFTKTEDYKKVVDKFKEYNRIYDELVKEYQRYEQSLSKYQEYIDSERERKSRIYEEGIKSIIKRISSIVPSFLQEKIKALSLEDNKELLFGSIYKNNFTDSLLLEYFNEESMDELYSKDTSLFRKKCLAYLQIDYFKKLDINIPDKKFSNEEELNNYLNFIKQDKVQEFIPSQYIIDELKKICQEEADKCLKKYYIERDDFQKIVERFYIQDNYYDYMMRFLKNKLVCVTGEGGKRDNEYASVMFYTIRDGDFGSLANTYLHELGHVLDDVEGKACGLDNNVLNSNEKNPYDNSKRKYEVFNEALNDLFTMEAEDYLESQGIYLLEDKDHTKLDHSDENMKSLTKRILKPLIELYRDYIIKAKINADRTILSNYIGEDNFEQLVDFVNKVQALTNKFLSQKFEKDKEAMYEAEYNEPLERVKQIYSNMEKYVSSKLDEEHIRVNR